MPYCPRAFVRDCLCCHRRELLAGSARSLSADDTPPEGYRSLFDGKTLSGNAGAVFQSLEIRRLEQLPHLTTWINGVKIAELDTDKTEIPNFDKKAISERLGRRGRISLEAHSNGPNDRLGKDRWSPDAICRWRHIFIKELGK